MGRAFNTNYVVFEDLKGEINEEFLKAPDEKQIGLYNLIYGKKPSVSDLLKEREPYEKSMRCLKSVRTSMQVQHQKKRSSHCFLSTERNKAFNFNERLIPKQVDQKNISPTQKETTTKVSSAKQQNSKQCALDSNKLTPEEVRKKNENDLQEKLKKLVTAMLWEEKLLEKEQVPELSSQVQPSKYNLSDVFFRKAFITKPELSEATVVFNRSRQKKKQNKSVFDT